MIPARLVLERTVLAEFRREIPHTLLRLFTAGLFCGRDAAGRIGRQVTGRELRERMAAVGWGDERAMSVLAEEIDLALEAYRTLPEPVRDRLGWPAETVLTMTAPEWVRQFATESDASRHWLLTLAGSTPTGLLLGACLLARPLATATLWTPSTTHLVKPQPAGAVATASTSQLFPGHQRAEPPK